MNITFFGAAREVTGSRHLLEVGGKKILLDCGLVQGRREEAEKKNRTFPFDVNEIDAVIVSHAHIDHSGNLPGLVRAGYTGPIHCTRATAGLLSIMLMDSAFIQEKDIHFVNKRHRRRNEPTKEPLYTEKDAEKAINMLTAQFYGKPFSVVPGVTATFKDAGHILGSALTILDLEENGTRHRLCYSGDLGRPHLPIIRDPETVAGVDSLIMESTYGNRLHESTEDIPDLMEDLLNRAHARGGKIIIPSFAIGRTQEIVSALKELFESGRVPEMPVYVDSPLAVNATDIFKEHEECFDEETLTLLRDEKTDPFGFRLMRYVRSVDESKSLNKKPGPMIIISASGMCEAGRILHHLRNNIENPDTLVLMVGFQAAHTLGRRLIDGPEEVKIFGEPHPLRAEVKVMDAFSAHADKNELVNWVEGLEDKPKKIFIVHGEETQALSFSETLQEAGHTQVVVPELGQTHQL
jgi:metallo-beta-lactamase family protein